MRVRRFKARHIPDQPRSILQRDLEWFTELDLRVAATLDLHRRQATPNINAKDPEQFMPVRNSPAAGGTPASLRPAARNWSGNFRLAHEAGAGINGEAAAAKADQSFASVGCCGPNRLIYSIKNNSIARVKLLQTAESAAILRQSLPSTRV
jgi:hypothetical protein